MFNDKTMSKYYQGGENHKHWTNIIDGTYKKSYSSTGNLQFETSDGTILGLKDLEAPVATQDALGNQIRDIGYKTHFANGILLDDGEAYGKGIKDGINNTIGNLRTTQGNGAVNSLAYDVYDINKDLVKTQITKLATELQIDPAKAAAAIAAGTYFSGAFEPKPIDVYTPTYNLAVAELQKQRGGLKYIDPITGEEKVFDQPYIPEEGRDPKFRTGPIELSKNTFNTGGLASIPKYNEGGVNFLPSKISHDENDSNNYVRAQGYVEDGSGTGDKDEDTMLAQLADGEFVTRADGVLGAGIIAGGNPNSMKDMREKGAQYFYEQQKRYKRVFDLIQEANGKNSKTN